MDKSVITFRLDREKKEALDRLASQMDRDRSYLLNEAVSTYLETQAWQLEQIRAGVEEADRGEFASDDEVKRALSRWRP